MKTSVFLKMLGVVLASLLFSNCFFAKSNTESGESVLETNDSTAHTDSCGTSSVVCKSVGDTFAIELQSNPSHPQDIPGAVPRTRCVTLSSSSGLSDSLKERA